MSTLAMRSPAIASHARRAIAPALAAVVIVALWQGAVSAFGISSFILPAPSTVARALADEWPIISHGARVTLTEVLVGLALGTVTGVAAALVVTRFRTIATPVLVVAIVVNCAPIVALAPITNNWLGVDNLFSKATVAGIMVFFPVMVGTSRGLLEVPSTDLDVMESLAATPRQVVWLVRVPHALGYLFSALRVATSLAVIGVIVTEYLGGRADALGVYIAQQAALPHYAEAWAGIAVACALGLGLFACVVVLERIVVPWRAEEQDA